MPNLCTILHATFTNGKKNNGTSCCSNVFAWNETLTLWTSSTGPWSGKLVVLNPHFQEWLQNGRNGTQREVYRNQSNAVLNIHTYACINIYIYSDIPSLFTLKVMRPSLDRLDLHTASCSSLVMTVGDFLRPLAASDFDFSGQERRTKTFDNMCCMIRFPPRVRTYKQTEGRDPCGSWSFWGSPPANSNASVEKISNFWKNALKLTFLPFLS